MDSAKEPAHKPIKAFGSHPMGAYSTKCRMEKGADSFGHIVPYASEPYNPSGVYKRDAYKGAQMKVRHQTAEFNKLVYNASAYEDKTVRNLKGAKGFCSSKPFGRDDVSSMLDTLRYRHALEKELKHSMKQAMAAGHEQPTAEGGEPREGARTEFTGTLGLSSRFPKDISDFDRIRFQDQFVSKVPYAEKYARDYGSYNLASRDIGDGCGDLEILHSPTHGKRAMRNDFFDKSHLVTATLSGYKAT